MEPKIKDLYVSGHGYVYRLLRITEVNSQKFYTVKFKSGYIKEYSEKDWEKKAFEKVYFFERHKKNLCYTDTKIFSYQEAVATITPFEIRVKKPTFKSRTRHLNYAAKILNLNLVYEP